MSKFRRISATEYRVYCSETDYTGLTRIRRGSWKWVDSVGVRDFPDGQERTLAAARRWVEERDQEHAQEHAQRLAVMGSVLRD